MPYPSLVASLVGCLALVAAGCASDGPGELGEQPSAESYYQSALELLEGERAFLFFQDVNYARAIELFQEVIDNYPYSEYATLAELKIADVHFEQERYEEASSYYQDFVELHPNHEQVPYALYRNGLSSFERMREPDQDQTPTHEAVAHFNVLLERYPRSKHAPDAEMRLTLARNQLAQHEVEVGDFYFDRESWSAAIGRYRAALAHYPSHDGRARTMARLGIALKQLQRLYEAERLFRQVLKMDPDDDTLEVVEAELDDLSNWLGFDAGRSLRRSCVTDPNPSCQDVDENPDARVVP
jgi:outer membrane protein assembly factor BamD